MTTELPPSGNPDDRQPGLGQLDPTSVPGTPGYTGAEAFRFGHVAGYAADMVERKALDTMAVSGIIGVGTGWASEAIIDVIETDAKMRDTAQTLIEAGHHGANIVAILGGIVMVVSATRAVVRVRRMRKTYDVQR